VFVSASRNALSGMPGQGVFFAAAFASAFSYREKEFANMKRAQKQPVLHLPF
jgi:hypothetical protein